MSAPDVDSGSPVTVAPSPEHNDTFLDTGLGNMATRAGLLALFIIVGFVGNCVLVATIAQSQRLKVFKLNLFILSVAIVNLINCIVNMPLILGNAITEKWDYGDFVCRFNAFTLQLASIAMVLGLMLMSLDRFLAVRYNDINKYTRIMTPMRANILIVYSWLHAFGFSVPLLFGIIPVKAFPARYLCSIDSGASIFYLALNSVFGFVIPLIIVLGFFIYIIKTSIQERMRRKQSHQSYAEESHTEDTEEDIQKEINTAKFVGVVLSLWCLCEGPYLILTAIEQYKNSTIIQESGLILNFEYPWEIDLSFTWLKLSYAIVLPIVTLFWRKEVWQKFKNCVLCRKSNLVKDASPKKKHHRKKEEARKKLALPEANKVEMSNSPSFTVPVLFATPQGLQVQTVAKKETDSSEKETDLELGFDSTKGDSSVITTKCDVYGSQNFLDLDDRDTSDYDSEMDPFAGSNPISVHTKTSLDIASTIDSDRKEVDVEKADIKLDDSGLAFNTNSKERDKGNNNNKKKKKDKVDIKQEDAEDIDQGIILDDKNDQDSGRGSYGENSLRKKKRRRRGNSTSEDNPPAVEDNPAPKPSDQAGSESQPPPTEAFTEVNEVLPPPSSLTKKKKKNKRKLRPPESGVDNPVAVEADNVENTDSVERKPIPALRRPAPPRLNPIKNNEEYYDKISVAGDADNPQLAFEPRRPLPELPEKARRTQRQFSEQPRSLDPASQNSKSHTRSISESGILSQTDVPETPTPAPRKSRPKSFVAEEEESTIDSKPLKRKERKRTTSQSDSQTMLLQSSNTSTDLSDLQELNKQAHRNEPASNGGPPANLPKLKKNRKKAGQIKSDSPKI